MALRLRTKQSSGFETSTVCSSKAPELNENKKLSAFVDSLTKSTAPDKSLKAYEKHFKVYALLSIRQKLNPLFLNRTLSYLQPLKKTKTKSEFKVDDILAKKQPRKLMKIEIESLTIENTRDIEYILTRKNDSDLIKFEIHGLTNFPPSYEATRLSSFSMERRILQFVYGGANQNVERIFADLSNNDGHCFVFDTDKYACLQMKCKIGARWHRLYVPLNRPILHEQTVDCTITGSKTLRSDFYLYKSNDESNNSVLFSFESHSSFSLNKPSQEKSKPSN